MIHRIDTEVNDFVVSLDEFEERRKRERAERRQRGADRKVSGALEPGCDIAPRMICGVLCERVIVVAVRDGER